MGIKDVLSNMARTDEIYRRLEAEDKAMRKLEQRKKTGNERALERYMEERRQKMIDNQLKKITKEKENEFWHKDIITQKPIFQEKKGQTIMKQKNLFGGKHGNF